MNVADAVAVAGHEVHVCRYREARTLLRWLGEDLRGLRVLDVAGGDGYWAAEARGRGARAVALDLAGAKLQRGRQLSAPPALIRGNALELPFADASFDRVMSICAIEHFDDGARALDEMARVLAPGGELVMSADALTLAEQWPRLYRAHCERYHVQRTYSHGELAGLLSARGLEVIAHPSSSGAGGRSGCTWACPLTGASSASTRRLQRRRWWPPRTAARTARAGLSCSCVLDAGDRLRPARGEVLTGDSEQGVGFIVVGTSTKTCRGRAVDASSAWSACPGGPGKEQVRSWHLAY